MSKEFDFGSLRTKKEINHSLIAPETKEIKKELLHKPKSVKSVPKTEVSQDFLMDFNYLVNNSSFQRAITEFVKHTFPAYKGIDHRASKEVMNQQIQDRTNEIDNALEIVKQMDTELLREIRANPLYLKQKSKNKI